MLGFYNYTVILTYISLLCSICGMFLAVGGHPFLATFCLMFCGLFDAFDGKIARTRKQSTNDEKRFGIQIDSLCDVICFGVLPCFIGYSIGMKHFAYVVVFGMFVLAALIRLAYFNVMEEKRQETTTEKRKYYSGLPVTSVSLILPLLHILCYLLDIHRAYSIAYAFAMVLIAAAFLCPFRVKKPGWNGIVIMIGIGVVELLLILLFRFRIF